MNQTRDATDPGRWRLRHLHQFCQIYRDEFYIIFIIGPQSAWTTHGHIAAGSLVWVTLVAFRGPHRDCAGDVRGRAPTHTLERFPDSILSRLHPHIWSVRAHRVSVRGRVSGRAGRRRPRTVSDARGSGPASASWTPTVGPSASARPSSRPPDTPATNCSASQSLLLDVVGTRSTAKSATGSQREPLTCPVRTATGESISCELQLNVLVENSELAATVGTLRNVTGRAQRERARTVNTALPDPPSRTSRTRPSACSTRTADTRCRWEDSAGRRCLHAGIFALRDGEEATVLLRRAGETGRRVRTRDEFFRALARFDHEDGTGRSVGRHGSAQKRIRPPRFEH